MHRPQRDREWLAEMSWDLGAGLLSGSLAFVHGDSGRLGNIAKENCAREHMCNSVCIHPSPL